MEHGRCCLSNGGAGLGEGTREEAEASLDLVAVVSEAAG
jgi:hypothetical protein